MLCVWLRLYVSIIIVCLVLVDRAAAHALYSFFGLQVVQEMLEEAVSQLMSIQSQRANVPPHILFPFVPAKPSRQLASPVRATI